jgi:hypothetical protein
VLGRALGKIPVNGRKYFAECRPKHSAKYFNILPSAPIKSTRQSPFAKKNFAERTLLSATLGKAFAEWKGLFAECKPRPPVVTYYLASNRSCGQ